MYFGERNHPMSRRPTTAPSRPGPERLPEPQSQQISLENQRHRRLGLWSGFALAVVLAITGSFLFFYMHYNNSPLPASITKNASFPVYYPSPLPTGYTYKKNSAKLESGIVFFALQNAGDTVTISEQAVPPNPPDLTHLTGFTDFQTIAGDTAVGTSLGKPIAITLSNTTLITITGARTVPSDVIAAMAKTMTSLPQ